LLLEFLKKNQQKKEKGNKTESRTETKNRKPRNEGETLFGPFLSILVGKFSKSSFSFPG
jgi:flagellar biosynthesis protein FlhB